MPRRRGLRPRLFAAVVRSEATLAFAAEGQIVGRTSMRGLDLPPELGRLIAAGAWPSSRGANRQNLEPRSVPGELVQRLAPGHDQLYLYPPPFALIAECIARGEGRFWEEWGCLDEVDPRLALLIDDFGLGSDTAIALDYRNRDLPAVIRLAWTAEDQGTHWAKKTNWVPFFPTFAEFADAFGIGTENLGVTTRVAAQPRVAAAGACAPPLNA